MVLEVNSETDFVAKNAEFVKFVNRVAQVIIDSKPASVEELMSCKDASGEDVAAMLQEKVLTIGENIQIRRFERLEGTMVPYVHGEGRIGVMVLFDTDVAEKEGFEAYGKDVAMQVAAASPQYLDKESVDPAVLEKEKEILTVQAMNEGKPANIAEKMVAGRIQKFYKEVCLVEQPFVKDGDISVGKYTENVAKELGGSIRITGFVRYERGEGLQKREDNFAAEVAGMIG